MIRSTSLALAALLLPLGACGEAPPSPDRNEAATLADNAASVEELPADGLAAPEGMPEDVESNGVGSAGGGNAM